MHYRKATENDLPLITGFYRDAIERTPDMRSLTQWVYGLYPCDELIADHIRDGHMWLWMKEDILVGAAAVTKTMDADYRGKPWKVLAAEDEVSVVHILCVNPDHQRQGVARGMLTDIRQIARSMGKKAIRLDAISTNPPAQHLYETDGFTCIGILTLDLPNTGLADLILYESAL